MLYFIIYLITIIIINSLVSLRNYQIFHNVFKNLNYFRFHEIGNLKIANMNSKNEFIIISDWNFRINSNTSLQFDIWALVDFHKLFWLIKFNHKIKELPIYKFI
jgi:hypothetical protein